MFKSKIRDGGMPHHHELTGSGGSTISFHSRRRARGVWIQAISYLVGRLRSCVTLFNASVRPSCSSSLLWANITMQTRCDSCMHHGCQAACWLHDPPVSSIRRHARPRQNRGSGCPPLDSYLTYPRVVPCYFSSCSLEKESLTAEYVCIQ